MKFVHSWSKNPFLEKPDIHLGNGNWWCCVISFWMDNIYYYYHLSRFSSEIYTYTSKFQPTITTAS